MADYTVDIGGSSTMMIRDTGGWVEFWFRTGSSTWNNEQPWSYFANGASSGTLHFRLLRGGNWQHFGSVYVGYDQDISFTIVNSGLGFPTHNFVQHIQRSTVPPPPNLISVTPISTTAFHVIFQGTGDGGLSIIEWQIGYGTSSNGPSFFVSSGGTSDVGGFISGQRIYFWARGRNALGWGGWSNRREATTWTVPRPPGKAAFYNVTQTSVDILYAYAVESNNPIILQRQVGYGKNIFIPTDYEDDPDGLVHLTDLDPGQIYYVWARSRNSVGWGPWSIRSQVTLIAGARILVSNEWKRAVPYVKVSGVWKVAQPWIKYEGEWKATST